MKFGVNYTPRKGWFHSWLDFDPGEVKADFEAIAGLGADHVRIFPLWPLLQPNRTLIRAAGIADVVRTVQIAAECGLDASVDVLQGHLSSFDFLPAWVQTWHRRNLFTDPLVVQGQRALVHELAVALRELPNATGLTLGNEFVQFAATRHPDYDAISSAQARAWLQELLGQAKADWPGGVHVHSHDDDVWFDDTQAFTPQMAVSQGDQTTVHSWVFGRVGPRFGKSAPQLPWFARYLCELAAAWNPTPRPVWLQEIGAPENYIDPIDAPQFLLDTVDILMGKHGGGVSPHLCAITWWCSHDVSRQLADFPALEHSLGLIDEDGNAKPIGDAFALAARQWHDVDYVSAPASPTSAPEKTENTQVAESEGSAEACGQLGVGQGASFAEQQDCRPEIVFAPRDWRRSHISAEHDLFDRWYEAASEHVPPALVLDTSRYLDDPDDKVRRADRAQTPFLSTQP
ncbi:MAG: hypothetical protein Q4P06_03185 [Actinomycetaceae bacterium]|nr:hypothetical protein [Actinomycetaceae bacterium]